LFTTAYGAFLADLSFIADEHSLLVFELLHIGVAFHATCCTA